MTLENQNITGARAPNPPAFPLQVHASPNSEIQEGMTLRDWFAGQALAGIVSGDWAMAITDAGQTAGLRSEASIALGAYEIADAMLAARNQEPAK